MTENLQIHMLFFSVRFGATTLTMTLKCVCMWVFGSYHVYSLTCQCFLFMQLAGYLQQDY